MLSEFPSVFSVRDIEFVRVSVAHVVVIGQLATQAASQASKSNKYKQDIYKLQANYKSPSRPC